MIWSCSMHPVVLPWGVCQKRGRMVPSVLTRSCVWRAEVHLNMHYNVQCLPTRPSVKNWSPWSRSSSRRGRTPQVCWLCSRLQISWQHTYPMSTLQHLRGEWLPWTWVSAPSVITAESFSLFLKGFTWRQCEYNRILWSLNGILFCSHKHWAPEMSWLVSKCHSGMQCDYVHSLYQKLFQGWYLNWKISLISQCY